MYLILIIKLNVLLHYSTKCLGDDPYGLHPDIAGYYSVKIKTFSFDRNQNL